MLATDHRQSILPQLARLVAKAARLGVPPRVGTTQMPARGPSGLDFNGFICGRAKTDLRLRAILPMGFTGQSSWGWLRQESQRRRSSEPLTPGCVDVRR